MTNLDQDEVLYTLLCKYLLHEADAAERRQVEDWLREDPQHSLLFGRLEKLLATGPAHMTAAQGANTDLAWDSLWAAIEQLEASQGSSTPPTETVTDQEQLGIDPQQGATKTGETPVRPLQPAAYTTNNDGQAQTGANTYPDPFETNKRRPNRLYWAAAAILVFVAATIWKLNTPHPHAEFYTGPITARLSDGTTIELEPKAELNVRPGYNQPDRSATLTGQALFHVTPNADHPFNLIVGSRLVQVLGTTFRISYASATNALRIHVDSGTVMVKDSTNRDSVLLTAGMLLEAQGQQHVQVAAHIKDADKKQLEFTDTPLKEVLAAVAIVYHLDITADSSLQQLPVTATFTGETADNVLNAVAFMTNTTITHNGQTIMLVK
jgi:transmembrane sensor